MLYGLTAGRTREPCDRFTQRSHWFQHASKNSLAELSFQNESSSSAALEAAPTPPFSNNAYQARSAQIAPPEVPLKATIS